VRSIVDRFLEHTRIMVFGEGDEVRVFLSSADWMPRNFYRRVEVMFPVESPQLVKRIVTEIVPAFLADNVKSRQLRSDGTYQRVEAGKDERPYRCQEELLELTEENAASKMLLPTNGFAGKDDPARLPRVGARAEPGAS